MLKKFLYRFYRLDPSVKMLSTGIQRIGRSRVTLRCLTGLAYSRKFSSLKKKAAPSVRNQSMAINKPVTTLDDIYASLKTPRTSSSLDADDFALSSGTDGIYTQIHSKMVQRWSLFEACLKSQDYRRAELILENLAATDNANTSYYTDGIAEYLKMWGMQPTISMEDVHSWLDRMGEIDASFREDARVYAWIVRLGFDKSEPIDRIMRSLEQFQRYGNGDTTAKVFAYADIVGISNIQKLVSTYPELRKDIPEEYKDLLDLLDSEPQVDDLTTDPSAPQTFAPGPEPVNQVETAPKAAIEVVDLDNEDAVVDNGLKELDSVMSWNLKAIRHSLVGLANSSNDHCFVEKFMQEADRVHLGVDNEAIQKTLNEGKQVNFFELKKSIPFENQELFDEVLDTVSQEREIVLETTTIEAAMAKWKHESDGVKGNAIPYTVGTYLHTWVEQLTPLIKNEVAEYRKAREYFDELAKTPDMKESSEYKTQQYQDRMEYGPYLSLLKPEKIATITVLEIMKLALTNDLARGTQVSKVVFTVAKAIHMEYMSECILAADIDIHHNFRAIRKTPEFKKFLRSSKAQRLVDKAEASALRHKSNETESSQKEWDVSSNCRLGSALTSLLMQVAKVDVQGVDPKSGSTVKGVIPAFYHTYTLQAGAKVGVLRLNQQFACKLGKDALTGLQPQFLPMLCKPKPWTTSNDGGYFLRRSQLLRSKGAPEQSAYAKAAAANGNMPAVLEGLNNLGQTAWTVNTRLLKTLTEVWNTREEFLEIPPVLADVEFPPKPSEECEAVEYFRWRRECTEAANLFNKYRSMRADMNYKLEIARAFVGERIFFPHSLDFRGRAYPIPPHFNHLGNDMARGLLKFWTGKQLGDEGLRWLKIHVCNLTGNDKISLDERVKYTEEHIDQIIDSAEHPLDGDKYWQTVDKPWQFLASAIELSEALKLDDPTQYVSHQPIYQDGTCNGLQHYAALGGDVEGARHVNLIPADRPSDIYTIVSRIVLDNVKKDCTEGNTTALACVDIISRKIVKQTVMTSVYGVTYVGARGQIRRRLKEIDFDENMIAPVSQYLTVKVFAAIRELFDGAHAIQDWLALAAKRVSKSVRMDIDVDDKTKFLSSVIWTTPLGLPVVQPYRVSYLKAVRTNLQTLMINDPYEVKTVDPRRQAQGFPPNFVHSLDATHMLMSANRCSEKELSFASVHDSYWTHACDVPVMNKILREEFVKLHTKNLIRKLRTELLTRYGDNLMIVQVDSTSPVGQEMRKYRKELAKKLGRPATIVDEIAVENRRRRLLGSSDPAQQQLGKELKSSITLLEELGYDQTDRPDKTGGVDILVPFCLPEVPPRGSFDVSVVQDSPYFFS